VLLAPPLARADTAGKFTETFTNCLDGKITALQCEKALWDIADVVKDGELTLAELTRLARLSGEAFDRKIKDEIKAGELSPGKPSSGNLAKGRKDVENVSFLFMAMILGPMTAQALIANFDYDGDGNISRKELYADLPEGKFTAFVAELAESGKQTFGQASQSIFSLWAQNALGAGDGGGLLGSPKSPKSGLSLVPKPAPAPKAKSMARAPSAPIGSTVTQLRLVNWSAAFHAQKPTDYYAINYTLQNDFEKEIKQIDGAINFREPGGAPFMSIQVAKGKPIPAGQGISLGGNYPVNAAVPDQMKLRNLSKQNVRAELSVDRVVFADGKIQYFSSASLN